MLRTVIGQSVGSNAQEARRPRLMGAGTPVGVSLQSAENHAGVGEHFVAPRTIPLLSKCELVKTGEPSLEINTSSSVLDAMLCTG